VVKSFSVTWQEATGEFTTFEIIRGDLQEELFERVDFAGTIMYLMLENSELSLKKQDQMLDKQDQMLDKQDKMLQIAFRYRGSARSHLRANPYIPCFIRSMQDESACGTARKKG